MKFNELVDKILNESMPGGDPAELSSLNKQVASRYGAAPRSPYDSGELSTMAAKREEQNAGLDLKGRDATPKRAVFGVIPRTVAGKKSYLVKWFPTIDSAEHWRKMHGGVDKRGLALGSNLDAEEVQALADKGEAPVMVQSKKGDHIPWARWKSWFDKQQKG